MYNEKIKKLKKVGYEELSINSISKTIDSVMLKFWDAANFGDEIYIDFSDKAETFTKKIEDKKVVSIIVNAKDNKNKKAYYAIIDKNEKDYIEEVLKTNIRHLNFTFFTETIDLIEEDYNAIVNFLTQEYLD